MRTRPSRDTRSRASTRAVHMRTHIPTSPCILTHAQMHTRKYSCTPGARAHMCVLHVCMCPQLRRARGHGGLPRGALPLLLPPALRKGRRRAVHAVTLCDRVPHPQGPLQMGAGQHCLHRHQVGTVPPAPAAARGQELEHGGLARAAQAEQACWTMWEGHVLQHVQPGRPSASGPLRGGTPSDLHALPGAPQMFAAMQAPTLSSLSSQVVHNHAPSAGSAHTQCLHPEAQRASALCIGTPTAYQSMHLHTHVEVLLPGPSLLSVSSCEGQL